MLGSKLAENGRNFALLPTTAITTAVTGTTTTPITGLEGIDHLIAQCTFSYGSGGTGADFFLQTSFDKGTTWTDVSAFRFPGVAGRNATDFDGSSDYYARTSDLTGNVNGKLGLLSCWGRIDGGDGAWRLCIDAHASRFYAGLTSTNKFRVYAQNAAGGRIFQQDTTTTYTAGSSWYNILYSYDLGNAKAYIYVDDVSRGDTPAALNDDTIDYTRPVWAIAAEDDGDTSWNGALAEFYFTNEYLDITIEANRRKFISANGNRVYLGADGSTPTGTAALIYCPDGDATNNLGTGGNFTAQGSPTSVTGPSVEEAKFQVLKSPIAVAANQSIQDTALTANTILDGVLGDRIRVKYNTTGTFADSSIKIDAVCKG